MRESSPALRLFPLLPPRLSLKHFSNAVGLSCCQQARSLPRWACSTLLRVPRAHRTRHRSRARHARLEAREHSCLLQATWPLFLPHTHRYSLHYLFVPVILLLLLLLLLLLPLSLVAI